MKLVLERTNFEVGSMGVGAGLYMHVVVVKSPRSLSHLLMSSCLHLRSIYEENLCSLNAALSMTGFEGPLPIF